MFKHTSTLARWSLTLAAAALSACGGGGGDPDDTELPPPSPPPPAAKSVTDLQGRWTGTVGTQAAAAMNLGDGTSWVVEYDAQDAPVAVTQGAWAVVDDAYTGSGRRVTVATGMATDVTMSVATRVADASLTGVFGGSSYSWTYGAGGEATLALAALAGTWSGNVDDRRATVTWTVTGAGALSGTSTTGCIYSGSLAARADGVAAVDLTVTETCAGTAKALSGIGTLDGSGTRASFPYLADDETGAGVFRLTRP